jgi:uncharacterized SAM-binding protein YcdF (DUF218 family)
LDTIFYIAGKTVWLLIRPETLLVCLLVAPLVCLWLGRIVAASRFLVMALLIMIGIGVVPVGNFLLNPLERAYASNSPITQPAGILVLGGAEDTAPAYAGSVAQINEAGDRLIAAMQLARQFPGAAVLYTGGKAAVTPVAADTFAVGPDILRQLGLRQDRLIVEGRSRTTAENAVLSRAVAPKGQGPWILVTSAFHMPRAMGSFCAAGWSNLVPFPTDYRGGTVLDQIGWNLAENLADLNTGVKEWVGLLAYRVSDRTEAFFPRGCD